MKIWLSVLSVIVILQWIKIYSLQDEIERIKSWYPFVELCKVRMQNFYKNHSIKFRNTEFKTAEKKEDKDDGEINRT